MCPCLSRALRPHICCWAHVDHTQCPWVHQGGTIAPIGLPQPSQPAEGSMRCSPMSVLPPYVTKRQKATYETACGRNGKLPLVYPHPNACILTVEEINTARIKNRNAQLFIQRLIRVSEPIPSWFFPQPAAGANNDRVNYINYTRIFPPSRCRPAPSIAHMDTFHMLELVKFTRRKDKNGFL